MTLSYVAVVSFWVRRIRGGSGGVDCPDANPGVTLQASHPAWHRLAKIQLSQDVVRLATQNNGGGAYDLGMLRGLALVWF
jgi:hypothetical protein